jgi:hypothetical protein
MDYRWKVTNIGRKEVLMHGPRYFFSAICTLFCLRETYFQVNGGARMPRASRARGPYRCSDYRDRFRPNALCSGTTATAAGLLVHELLREHTIPVLIHLTGLRQRPLCRRAFEAWACLPFFLAAPLRPVRRLPRAMRASSIASRGMSQGFGALQTFAVTSGPTATDDQRDHGPHCLPRQRPARQEATENTGGLRTTWAALSFVIESGPQRGIGSPHRAQSWPQ